MDRLGLVTGLALILGGTFNLLMPDRAIRLSRRWAAVMGLEDRMPGFFLSRLYARLIGAWGFVFGVAVVILSLGFEV